MKELEDFGGKGASAGVCAVIAFIGAACVLILPETLDKVSTLSSV